jgi:hypothetical protein
MHNRSGAIDELISFLDRSRVTRWDTEGRHGWYQRLPFLFDHLPYLEVLAIVEVGGDWDVSLEFMSSKARKHAWPPAFCQKLHTLRMHDCDLNLRFLTHLIEIHSIRELHLDRYYLQEYELGKPGEKIDYEKVQEWFLGHLRASAFCHRGIKSNFA